jgi:hypothetical protein
MSLHMATRRKTAHKKSDPTGSGIRAGLSHREADELRLKHVISYEKVLRHAAKRGISYPAAVVELVVKGNKT